MPVAASATTFAEDFATCLSALGLRRLQAGAAQLRFQDGSDAGRIQGHLYPVARTRPHGDGRRLHLSGWRLQLAAGASSQGRMVLIERVASSRFARWLNRRVGLRPVPLPPALAHLEGWCGDVAWAAALFDVTAIVGLVASLMPATGAPRPAALHWLPGQFRFAAGAGPDGAALMAGIERWCQQLPALVAHVDALPPPRQPWQPHWLEQRPRRVVAIVLSVLVLGMVSGAGLLLGLALLVHRLLHG